MKSYLVLFMTGAIDSVIKVFCIFKSRDLGLTVVLYYPMKQFSFILLCNYLGIWLPGFFLVLGLGAAMSHESQFVCVCA